MARLKFLLYASGIGLSYWYYGILQERITRTKHEPDGAIFTSTMTLVLLQCIVNAVFAKFTLAVIFNQGRDMTRSSYYGICSLTYLTAMVSSNMALRHVNYPTQVIGKSCKPIPIMILGVLIGRKRYTARKYLFILLIVIGVALFLYKKEVSLTDFLGSDPMSSPRSFIPSLGIGETLLVISLSMDGVTGAIQERMKTEHATKSGHMMFNVNLYSSVYLIAATAYTGEAYEFYNFIATHPKLIVDIGLFSCLSAIGQLFIFLTVSEYGPLPCSVITTTRKFFTVLTSVFIFGNKLTMTQWLGTSLVFFGLSLDAIYGKDSNDKPADIAQRKKKKN